MSTQETGTFKMIPNKCGMRKVSYLHRW